MVFAVTTERDWRERLERERDYQDTRDGSMADGRCQRQLENATDSQRQLEIARDSQRQLEIARDCQGMPPLLPLNNLRLKYFLPPSIYPTTNCVSQLIRLHECKIYAYNRVSTVQWSLILGQEIRTILRFLVHNGTIIF